MAHVTVDEVLHALRDADLPATKDELIQAAMSQLARILGAGEAAVAGPGGRLGRLADRQDDRRGPAGVALDILPATSRRLVVAPGSPVAGLRA
jgi:hypothetical protein